MATKKLHLWKERAKDFSVWLIMPSLLLTSSWLADALRELLEAIVNGKPLQDPRPLWLTVGYVAGFGGSVLGTWWAGRRFLHPRTRYMNNVERPEKREHLVIFLSELTVPPGKKVEDIYTNGMPEWFKPTDSMLRDIANLEKEKVNNGKKWQWEMPLRGIAHHLGKLESVAVVVSTKSIDHAQWFLDWVRGYPELGYIKTVAYLKQDDNPAVVETIEKGDTSLTGWDFEAFDDLSQALLEKIVMFKELGVSESKIMIDFTGGQKVTSVVAAMITINRKVKTQYVQTEMPWRVVGYDIQIGSAQT